MPEPIGLHICFNELGREIEVLDVTFLIKDTYRVEETPIFNPSVTLGDIIRVKEERGIYYYVETIEKSNLSRYAWLLSKETVNSMEIAAFKQRIYDIHGKWEQIFGGFLVIHIPKDAAMDVDEEMKRIIERFEN